MPFIPRAPGLAKPIPLDTKQLVEAQRWKCATCNYTWWAPTAKGCPTCGTRSVERIGEMIMDYSRA